MNFDNPYRTRRLLAEQFNNLMLPAAGYRFLPGRFVLSKPMRRRVLDNLHHNCKNLAELP